MEFLIHFILDYYQGNVIRDFQKKPVIFALKFDFLFTLITACFGNPLKWQQCLNGHSA